ncbi:MAG: cohesin domain-containing protein [Patescibacteria group bacterium]
MKKFAAIFLSMAFAFANVGILPVLAAGSGTLTLMPASESVKSGDSFNITVQMNAGGASIDTVRVDLSYDATLLSATSFNLGTLFPNLSPSNSIDNKAGTLSYGAYKFGTPVTSSGVIGTVTFKALATGAPKISVLSSSKLIQDGT